MQIETKITQPKFAICFISVGKYLQGKTQILYRYLYREANCLKDKYLKLVFIAILNTQTLSTIRIRRTNKLQIVIYFLIVIYCKFYKLTNQ